MSDVKIRRNRLQNEAAAHLKANVRSTTKKEIEDAARASGQSLGLYLEQLLQVLRTDGGSLPIFSNELDMTKETPTIAA